MGRMKIDYGIDLGTTNSAIVRMENGKAVVKKTDVGMDTLPSCVSFRKKTIQVGQTAFNQLRSDKSKAMKNWDKGDVSTFIEFKRTMGTDKKYQSNSLDKDYSSEELSAEVLKKLKSLISDEEVKAIIVTVPAKFTVNQKDATTRAAYLAGFEHCELLQEPIAASMAYGIDANVQNGYWLVFDFGGGTFDAALLKVEDGIMKVIDTEGDNYLGGKNLDYAIVDDLIIPYLRINFSIEGIVKDDLKKEIIREAMKYFAEETKIQLSFKEQHNILSDLGDIPGKDENGNEFEIDLTVSQADLSKIVGPIFQKSINICKDLLNRNNLKGKELERLILVGGPTYSPILRNMLKEQITVNVDTNVDPMTVVAKGAALFASTVNVSEKVAEQTRDKSKIQLILGYEPTTVEMEEFVTIKIDYEKTSSNIPDKMMCEFSRSDKAWSSGKMQIDRMGVVIELKLLPGKANLFDIVLFDEKGNQLLSEPSSLNIIQGSKVGSAVLPYHIGIDAKSRITDKTGFTAFKGLEKNKSIPSKGVINGLKTQKQIRPGMIEDFFKIPIYQGEYNAEGSRASNNEHVYDVIISGQDVPSLLPENSDVDITLYVNNSERMKMEAYFPLLDHTCEIKIPTNNVQNEIDANYLKSEINKAKQSIVMIKQEGILKDLNELNTLSNEISELDNLLEQGKSDYDRKKQVLDNLKRVLKKIDQIQEDSEWPRVEEELKDVFYRLEMNNKEFGNQQTTIIVNQLKEQIPIIIKERNVKLAKELIENMRSLDFSIVDEGLGPRLEIGLLQQFNQDFNTHEWSDRNRARLLINQGMQIAANNPTKERLRPIVIELFKLLPKAERAVIPGAEDLLIH
jgi:molecular chaperone DnaK